MMPGTSSQEQMRKSPSMPGLGISNWASHPVKQSS